MERYLILIIALFSVNPSILGMGLLVFRTPTLVLVGYPFGEVLSIPLPPSLTISATPFYPLDKIKKTNERFYQHILSVFMLVYTGVMRVSQPRWRIFL